MKRRLSTILTVIMILSLFPTVAFASTSVQATPSSSNVIINGKAIAFEAYNINSNNYFKLRDLAMALNSSNKQFGVSWDEDDNSIKLESNCGYTSVGGELNLSGIPSSISALPTSSKVKLNGHEVPLIAYNINGNNYFKLREIGSLMNFAVNWDAENNAINIITDSDYVPDKSFSGDIVYGPWYDDPTYPGSTMKVLVCDGVTRRIGDTINTHKYIYYPLKGDEEWSEWEFELRSETTNEKGELIRIMESKLYEGTNYPIYRYKENYVQLKSYYYEIRDIISQ